MIQDLKLFGPGTSYLNIKWLYTRSGDLDHEPNVLHKDYILAFLFGIIFLLLDTLPFIIITFTIGTFIRLGHFGCCNFHISILILLQLLQRLSI